jgi:hypothetical protein
VEAGAAADNFRQKQQKQRRGKNEVPKAEPEGFEIASLGSQ